MKMVIAYIRSEQLPDGTTPDPGGRLAGRRELRNRGLGHAGSGQTLSERREGASHPAGFHPQLPDQVRQ